MSSRKITCTHSECSARAKITISGGEITVKSEKPCASSGKPPTVSAHPIAATASTMTDTSGMTRWKRACSSHNSKSPPRSAKVKTLSGPAMISTGRTKCSTKATSESNCVKSTKGSKFCTSPGESMASQSTKGLPQNSGNSQTCTKRSRVAKDDQRIKVEGGYILATASMSRTVSETKRSVSHSKKNATSAKHDHSSSDSSADSCRGHHADH